jgi:hypothetical protein
MVEAEQPTESHLPMHGALGHRQPRPRPEQPIAQPLVVALGVVVLEELRDGPSQHALAEEHHLRQALVFDGLHELLGDGVHVGRSDSREHGLGAGARQRLAARGRRCVGRRSVAGARG